MPRHQEKKPNPKNVPFLNYIDVTRGYPSDKQDFFLVCLLFMGNNEFNLIWLLCGRGRMATGFHPRRKKSEIDIPQDRQAVYSEMPRQDWTLHNFKVFGSLFLCVGPRQTLNYASLSFHLSATFFHPENSDGNFSCLIR